MVWFSVKELLFGSLKRWFGFLTTYVRAINKPRPPPQLDILLVILMLLAFVAGFIPIGIEYDVSSFIHSFTYPFIHPFIYPSIPLFIYSSIPSLIYSSIPSLIYPFIHIFFYLSVLHPLFRTAPLQPRLINYATLNQPQHTISTTPQHTTRHQPHHTTRHQPHHTTRHQPNHTTQTTPHHTTPHHTTSTTPHRCTGL